MNGNKAFVVVAVTTALGILGAGTATTRPIPRRKLILSR